MTQIIKSRRPQIYPGQLWREYNDRFKPENYGGSAPRTYLIIGFRDVASPTKNEGVFVLINNKIEFWYTDCMCNDTLLTQ